jgi:hypothetical protein
MQFLKNLQQKQNRPPNGMPMDVTTSPSASPKANLGTLYIQEKENNKKNNKKKGVCFLFIIYLYLF